MMSKYISYLWILMASMLLYNCKKNNAETISLDNARNNTNSRSYPTTTMDSIQAINTITKQKVREVLELSILYQNGNKDSEIDEAVYRQALGYFHKPDSMTLSDLLIEIDTLKVNNVTINDFSVEKRIFKKDTLNFAKFSVEYFDKHNQPIGTFEREAQYILIPAEIRFKKEFKFYFLNFYNSVLKEKTKEGVIK